MGCGGSKPARSGRSNDPGIQLVNLQSTPASGQAQAGPSVSRPARTTLNMSPAIRQEFLTALHRAFGEYDYGVIGGTALAEYGSRRATSDIDVMIPSNISEVADQQLIARGMVRTGGGGLG